MSKPHRWLTHKARKNDKYKKVKMEESRSNQIKLRSGGSLRPGEKLKRERERMNAKEKKKGG